MTDRERLIELIDKVLVKYDRGCLQFVMNEIADHLLANGVIVPPCKVGDTAYFLNVCKTAEDFGKVYVDFGKIMSIAKHTDEFCVYLSTNSGVEHFFDYQIGKTVFLTKEEAEQALKERGKNA